MRSAKSNNGRTNWIVEQGRLREYSPDSPMFTMTAVDTLILTDLLILEIKEIKAAAERELAGYSQTDDALRQREKYYEKKRVQELQEGATGVEVGDVIPIEPFIGTEDVIPSAEPEFEIAETDLEFTDAT